MFGFTSAFAFSCFLFFFFFLAAVVDFSPVNSAPMHCSRDPQNSLFSNFFIKNGSHGTIHTFKNCFTIVFSVFSKKKLYPNGLSLSLSLYGGVFSTKSRRGEIGVFSHCLPSAWVVLCGDQSESFVVWRGLFH